MNVLVVEDDTAIGEIVRQGLEASYFDVDVVPDGNEGLEQALTGEYGLIILDLMLPGMDGMSICQTLRSRRVHVPILMLTARDALEDRVEGLDTGADDYLVKPFEFPELLARVRALVRREKIHRTRVIRIGDLEIDTGTHRVSRSGRDILLTPREYTLLEALAAREGTTLSREYIQQRVWMDSDSYSNTVDVCVGQLRKKIDAEHETKLIHTVHRMGYMISRPDPDEACG
jgi:DNA-binding response OmpR family regulator